MGEKSVKKNIFFLPLIFSLSIMFCGVVEKLANKNPMIKSVTAFPSQIATQDTTILKVVAEDPDDDLLSYQWDSNSNGTLISSRADEVKWIAPSYSGKFKVDVKVTDENGGKTSGNVTVNVKGNESPIVTITQPTENEIITGLGIASISAIVDFQWPIGNVDFYVNGDFLFSDTDEPYKYNNWDISVLSGQKTITVRAYDVGDVLNFGADSIHVFIEGTIPVPK
jgi:hypothetical protein